ncbi:MAG: 50S ribosomal protein L17 [Cyclobacteriaceae bacterium]
MRHGKKFNHLGRKPAHRKATLSNMASSLILHKRINTTVAKAKALRKYVEPLITRSKDDTTHSRRVVFKYLQDKESVKELFGEVADKVASRPGGYTRIIKTGYRLGDNAEMCMMELVDFNELLLTETESGKSKTRRGRRKKKSSDDDAQPKAKTAETKEVEEKVEEKEATVAEAEVVEETQTEVEHATKEEEVVEEAVVEEVKAEDTATEVVAETKEEDQAEEKEDDSDADEKEEKKD